MFITLFAGDYLTGFKMYESAVDIGYRIDVDEKWGFFKTIFHFVIFNLCKTDEFTHTHSLSKSIMLSAFNSQSESVYLMRSDLSP